MRIRLHKLSPAPLALALAALAADAWAAPQHAVKVAPGATITLKNGKTAPAAQIQSELDQLQEALEREGYSLRASDKRRPPAKTWAAGARESADGDKKLWAAKVASLQKRQADGFRSLIKPWPPSGPAPSRNAFGLGDEGAIALDSRPPSSGSSVLQGEPLSDAYGESLGNRDMAAVYVAFALTDKATATSVGCEGSLEGGVYLFKEKRDLAKLVVKGLANTNYASGEVDLYLVGKMVDGFPKKDAVNMPNLRKTIASPEIGYSYGWSPISVGVTASVAAELGLAIGSGQETPSGGHTGKCTLGVTPYLTATGKATARVSAIAYAAEAQGTINLLSLKLPASTSVYLTQNPLALNETFTASLDTTYLDGGVALVIESNIPQQGEKITDFDWDTIYKKQLFEWDGMKATLPLANIHARQTLYK